MGVYLRRIWAVLRTFWWVLVLVLAAVFLGWLYLGRRPDKEKTSPVKQTVVDRVADRVRGAATDVQVETAVIKAKSDERRKELEEIRAEPSGKRRRERLAAILRKSL